MSASIHAIATLRWFSSSSPDLSQPAATIATAQLWFDGGLIFYVSSDRGRGVSGRRGHLAREERYARQAGPDQTRERPAREGVTHTSERAELHHFNSGILRVRL